MLLAVLEKKAGLDLAGHDVYVNVAGGVRITEPAVDLPVVAALASSFLDRPVPGRTALAGEVGLTGEVRGTIADVIDIVNASDAFVLSLDIPSGLDADTGRPLTILLIYLTSQLLNLTSI